MQREQMLRSAEQFGERNFARFSFAFCILAHGPRDTDPAHNLWWSLSVGNPCPYVCSNNNSEQFGEELGFWILDFGLPLWRMRRVVKWPLVPGTVSVERPGTKASRKKLDRLTPHSTEESKILDWCGTSFRPGFLFEISLRRSTHQRSWAMKVQYAVNAAMKQTTKALL